MIKFFISVMSQALDPPSPCHKLSHLLGPPPPSSATYFMDGPLRSQTDCQSVTELQQGMLGKYFSMAVVMSITLPEL